MCVDQLRSWNKSEPVQVIIQALFLQCVVSILLYLHCQLYTPAVQLSSVCSAQQHFLVFGSVNTSIFHGSFLFFVNFSSMYILYIRMMWNQSLAATAHVTITTVKRKRRESLPLPRGMANNLFSFCVAPVLISRGSCFTDNHLWGHCGQGSLWWPLKKSSLQSLAVSSGDCTVKPLVRGSLNIS